MTRHGGASMSNVRNGLFGVAVAAFLVLVGQGPAEAHETSVKGHIAGVNGGASIVVLNPVKTRVTWRLSSSKGGQVQMKMKKAEDQVGGKANSLGNTMDMDLVVNGVSTPQSVPFDIVNGKAKLKLPSMGLAPDALIEVRSITLTDGGGEVFGRLGFVTRIK